MNVVALLELLQARLARELANTPSPVPNGAAGDTAAPKVYLGQLPPRRPDSTSKGPFPCVIVRPVEGSLGRDTETASVELVCGVFQPDDQADSGDDQAAAATKTLMALAGAVILALKHLPNNILTHPEPTEAEDPDEVTGIPAYEKEGAATPVGESFVLQSDLGWEVIWDREDENYDPSYLEAVVRTEWQGPANWPPAKPDTRSYL